MKHSNRSVHHLSIAGCAGLLYAVLLMVGNSCGLVHGDARQGHHQHQGDQGSSTQNNFCAWACQATADAAVAVEPPVAAFDLAVGSSELSSSQFVLAAFSSAIHSRAPPSSVFFRLG
jgi:hypothetical protein